MAAAGLAAAAAVARRLRGTLASHPFSMHPPALALRLAHHEAGAALEQAAQAAAEIRGAGSPMDVFDGRVRRPLPCLPHGMHTER
jgi:hypothetical protein